MTKVMEGLLIVMPGSTRHPEPRAAMSAALDADVRQHEGWGILDKRSSDPFLPLPGPAAITARHDGR
ncbi:hypothetical protein NEE01_23275 [Sphingomonas sp. MMSM24]|uniref:Uncharacterized protein n=1 Tax=Sphingomonas lycopersici TaxID=2951807 RepID=A0AA42CSW0_9SPHN|nr:hypothetical protein [Sphingomonas lycopersici]